MFPALRSTSSESHLSAGRGGIVIKFELQRSKEVELRRVRGEFVSFEEVMTGVTHMWGSSARQIILEYVDEDGDRVRVASQAEWEEAIEQHKTSGAAAFKVFVRRGKKSEPRGRAESRPNEGDSGSDCDATPDVVRVDSPVRPKSPVAVPAAVARPASPMVPPLQLPTPAAVAAEVVAALTQPTVEEDESQQAVVELLSRLYDCDAAREMTNMFSTVDFTPVVKRRLDAVAGEVHVDIDNVAMRHLTIARCNMWIGSRQYEKAEATLRAALEVWPTDKVIEYNIACSASLRGDKVAALGMLEAAVTHGYNDAAQMLADPDLASVRGCGRFKRLVAAARGESETAPGAETPVVPAVATVVAPTPTVAAVTPTPKETADPVATLLAMFPTMTATQASEVLRKHRGSLAHAASSLL